MRHDLAVFVTEPVLQKAHCMISVFHFPDLGNKVLCDFVNLSKYSDMSDIYFKYCEIFNPDLIILLDRNYFQYPEHYERCSNCNPSINRKSFKFNVNNSKSCSMAVAAIIASGIEILWLSAY